MLLHDNEVLFAGVKDVVVSAKCLNLLEDLFSTDLKKKKKNLSRDRLFTGLSFSSFLNSSATETKENKLNVLKALKLLDKSRLSIK